MDYNGKIFDTSRLDQHKHDTEDFQETMDMLEKIRVLEEGYKPEKNVVISSDDPPVILSNYFGDWESGRG